MSEAEYQAALAAVELLERLGFLGRRAAASMRALIESEGVSDACK